jgi:excinuclease UvrABC nuclease subunit
MNIEAVSPLTLPSLSLRERRSLPECAAVYFVLNSNDEILYIGGTVNLFQRWLTHHRCDQLTNMGDGIRITWLECSEPGLLPEIETALIKHFQPTLNRTPIPVSAMPSKVTVTVVLTKEEKDRLQKLADVEDRSLSYLAGKFIREALHRAEPKQTEEANNKEDAA